MPSSRPLKRFVDPSLAPAGHAHATTTPSPDPVPAFDAGLTSELLRSRTHTRTHIHGLAKPTGPRCQEDTGSAATSHALPPVRHQSRSREGNGASRRHVHRVHDALHGLCPRGHGPPQIVPAVYGPAPASPPYTSPIHRSSIGAQTEPRGRPPRATRVRAGPAQNPALSRTANAQARPKLIDH